MYLHMLVIREMHARPPRNLDDHAAYAITAQRKSSWKSSLALWMAAGLIRAGTALQRAAANDPIFTYPNQKSVQMHGVANE